MMRRLRMTWRAWRTSTALDDAGGRQTPAGNDAMLRLDRALRATAPWSPPPDDLLPQTLWAIAQPPASASSSTGRRSGGSAWAITGAVARAAAVATLAIAAVGAHQWSTTGPAPVTEPEPIAATTPGLDRAVSEGLTWLAASTSQPSLLTEARSLAADASRALARLRAGLPRRPRLHEPDADS